MCPSACTQGAQSVPTEGARLTHTLVMTLCAPHDPELLTAQVETSATMMRGASATHAIFESVDHILSSLWRLTGRTQLCSRECMQMLLQHMLQSLSMWHSKQTKTTIMPQGAATSSSNMTCRASERYPLERHVTGNARIQAHAIATLVGRVCH